MIFSDPWTTRENSSEGDNLQMNNVPKKTPYSHPHPIPFEVLLYACLK
jgi:hypothetical protein